MQFSLSMSCRYKEFWKLQSNVRNVFSQEFKMKLSISGDQTLYILSSVSTMGCFTHATHKYTCQSCKRLGLPTTVPLQILLSLRLNIYFDILGNKATTSSRLASLNTGSSGNS